MEREEFSCTQFKKDFKSSLWQKWAAHEKHAKFDYYCEKIRGYSMHAFVEEKDTTQAYLTTPMSWLQRSNLARILTRSHVLAVEKDAWRGVPERTDAVSYVPTRGYLRMRHMYCYFGPDMPTFEPDLSHYYISKIMYVIS